MTEDLMDEGAAPGQDAREPLAAYAWVVPGEAEPEETTETREEFDRRVDERVRVARYPHSLHRLTLAPRELGRIKELDQQAAIWVPVATFAVTAVCAVAVVVLATKVAGDPGHGRLSDLLVAGLTLGFLAAGFGTLVRSQAYFDSLRPAGRLVRTDLADAYETVRDGASVFVELGVLPAALSRIADLLPRAEALLDFLVEHEARGGAVKGHPAYEQLIRMGAEVTVLTDMAEERLGRRSLRRRDRLPEAARIEPGSEVAALTPFETLADLVDMLGVAIPAPRRPSDTSTDETV